MKTFGFSFALLLLAFVSVPANLNAQGYSATLISPTAGTVLYPGQTVRVEWKTTFPKLPNPTDFDWCETELWLSLDGGKTFTMCISPEMDPKATSFYWTVPPTPTKAAILDVRFGCEPVFTEGYSPQTAARFEIAPVNFAVEAARR